MPKDPQRQDPDSEPATRDTPGRGEEDHGDADCRVELRDLGPFQASTRRYYEF